MAPGNNNNGWITTDFPKDGREVVLQLEFSVIAYWEPDLECWVLTNPLNVESVVESAKRPTAWKPRSSYLPK